MLALVALWITGIGIVGIDYAGKGMEYFLNPKLQAKIGIVVLLTFNGFLLHSAVLPALKKAGSLLKLSFNLRMLALFSGALSGVSWFYAAMLGVGRPLAWKYSLVELLAAYPVLIVGGFGDDGTAHCLGKKQRHRSAYGARHLVTRKRRPGWMVKPG